MAELVNCSENMKKNSNKKKGKEKIFRSIVLLVLVFCAAVVFSACDEEIQNQAEEKKAEYEESAHLNFPISNIRTLNPAVSNDEDTYYISRLIYDGLFRIDKNMTPTPVLCESYKFKKKGAQITIKLKEAYFHDGKKLKAKDVKFTIDAFKAAGGSCPYKQLVDKIYSAEVLSNSKVRIYFNDSNDMSVSMLTFPILPAHRYDSIYDLIAKKGSFKPVGTGRYKYKSFNSKISLELGPYKKYHDDPAENSLSFLVTSKSKSVYKLVEASSISALITKDVDREARVGNIEQKIIDFPGNEVEYLGFNFNRELMNNKNIRKAIAYAIDTDAVIEESFVNSGISNDTIFYPGFLGTEKKADKYRYNTSKARRMLKKQGYKDRNGDGKIENEYGAYLSVEILVNSDSALRTKAAKLIDEQLEDIGINSTVVAVAAKTYKTYLKNGSFDMYVGALTYDETLDLREILKGEEQPAAINQNNNTNTNNNSGSFINGKIKDPDEDTDEDEDADDDTVKQPSEQKNTKTKKNLSKKMDNQNYIRYYNGKVNQGLDEMMSGATVKEMTDAFNKVRPLLVEDIPYYCLLQRTYGAVCAPALEGRMDPVFDDYYNGIGLLKCKYEVAPKEE